MNKHAYLIIAHDNFCVLDRLIKALDDERNDVYVHVDQKVKKFPQYTTKWSKLKFLTTRLDVKWGSVSQIACEYLLFEEAFASNQKYTRYNLISGTHYPLKSNDEIYHFLDKYEDNQLLTLMYTNDYEIRFKLGYYHLFLSNFHSGNKLGKFFNQKLWHISVKIQQILSIKRKALNVSTKASNWVSITDKAVEYVLSEKGRILSRFKHTFCGDEYFIPYLLENHVDFKIQDDKSLLFDDFGKGSNPRFLTISDYEILKDSSYLFARKFSDNDLEILDLLDANFRK